MTDFYVILGVDRGADQEKIKRAYRRSAKRLHPDTSFCGASAEEFSEVTEAYKTLADTEKRRHYDEKLRREERHSRRGPVEDLIPGRADRFGGRPFGPSPHDPVTEIRPGGDRTHRRGRPGQELHVELVLSPRQAREGGLARVVLPVERPCPVCAAPVSDFRERRVCPHCLGTGRIRRRFKFSLAIPPRTVHGTTVSLPLEDIGLRGVELRVAVRVPPIGD